MSDCLTTAQIHDFLHDALAPDDKARVSAHLADCPPCRREVEKHRKNTPLSLDIAKAGAAADTETLGEDTGRRATADARESIEGYRILSEIHRGGQGIVYKAIQKATKRTVALKVLLSGAYGSARQQYRFEREIDLVASLDHPNIVTIYDSGVSRDGRPYFAMEYIHGQELDTYLATAHLPMDAKLRLFQRICDAVGHAHLRGIIHRDLKPGNIRIDANGTPHVLDFGLAKAAGSNLIANTAPATMTGEFMGTLQYASPEQTKGDPKLIDLRTDVYSLGVVLYEMLTNSRPYSVVGRIDEAIKTIVEVEPKKPSTVNRRIGNEVDTIVLKALAKDPERRYHSAASLAEDIRRFLAGEPIEAKRESRIYILKKTLAHYKRHALVAVTVMVLLSLVASVALHFKRQADRQSDILAKRRQGQRLVADAIILVDQRIRLPHAKNLLDQALRLSPDLEQAYLYRALLHGIDGFNARIEDKMFWLDKAVTDYYRAHLAAGGRPLSGETDTDSPARPGGGGSRAALLSAANLLLTVDRREEAQEYFSLAAEGWGAEEPAGGLPVQYDSSKDELVVLPNSLAHSPETAHMEPETDAVLRRVLTAGVYSLDPLLARSQDKYVAELLFDRLFKIDEDLQVIPNDVIVIVNDIAVSEDRLVWDIRLNPGLTWHDGAAFTADDVVFSWNQYETLQDMAHKARDTPWEAPLVGVDAIAHDHVRIAHKSAVATQEWDMTFDLIPEHSFVALVAENPNATFEELHKRFGRAPVGNGPYRWSKSEPGEIVVLERWEEYPGERPYFASVEFRIMPDRNKRINALAEGTIDALELNASEFRWFVNGESFRGRIAKAVYPSRLYEYICWNADGSNPFFDDRRVRQAMTCAINLGRLREQRFGGLYAPCLGIYQVGSWMYNEAIVPFQYDPDRSRTLLYQAGWRTEPRGDGIRTRAARRFEFSLLVPEVSLDTRSLVYDLQADLGKVGVTMNIEIAPWKECLARMRDHEFEAFWGAVRAGVHPDVEKVRWRTGGAKNYAGYSNPEVDRLYARARRTTSRATQRAYYQKIQELIYQDQPYTFLWHKPTLWAFNKRLRGVTSSPVGVAGFDPGPRAWWLPRGGE